MTCGFMNSAGTDLDSLFYTNNGNAGAVGYKTSAGVDLGNRYTNASTLGYSVGYKNSAGTDLGYLRGNLTAPTLSGVSMVVNQRDAHTRHYCSEYDESAEGYVSSGTYRTGDGVVTFTTSLTNSQPVTYCHIYVQIMAAHYDQYVKTYVAWFPGQTWYTDFLGDDCNVSVSRTCIGVLSNTSYTDCLVQTLNYVPTSYTFAYSCADDNFCDRRDDFRMKIVVGNNAGSNTYYSNGDHLKNYK